MPAAHIIPAIFTAIDRVTAPVRAMTRSVTTFATKANAAVNKLIPSFSGLGKEMLAFAGTASIVAGMVFSINAIKDYETAMASFRVIVGGTEEQFSKFKSTLGAVANETGKSTIKVAKAAENIAGLNATFAETPEKIAAVTKAAIVLSDASGDDLANSSANLVGIMNQFGYEAIQADKAINILAAGQAVGASSITNTAESFKNFGSVAAGANITMEESVGLVQTLGKFSVFGAEAGTKLRGSILKLQQAGVGYASGQFNINDALTEAKSKIDKLKTAKEKDAALTKMFGAENISTGRILLSNIEVYQKFTKAVENTTAAHDAQKLNNNTLAKTIDKLTDKWINLLTTNNQTDNSLNILKTTIAFVTENLETIILVTSIFVATLVTFKVVMAAVVAGQWLWATVQAVTLALQGKTLLFLQGNTAAMVAYRVITAAVTAGTWLMTTAQTAFNIAMSVGLLPIMAIIAAIAILVGLVYKFYRNWTMITEAFKTGGILGGIKAIGITLLDFVLEPIQKILELISKIPGMGWASGAAETVEKLRADIGAVNPEKDRQESISRSIEEKNQNVAIDINDKTGRANVKSSGNFVPVRTTSTLAFQ